MTQLASIVALEYSFYYKLLLLYNKFTPRIVCQIVLKFNSSTNKAPANLTGSILVALLKLYYYY